jgi:hypothetical protein
MKRASPILAGLLLLAWALPAAAATVSRDPAPLPDRIEDDSCGFTVEVTFPVNGEHAVSFYDADGNLVRIEITGRLVATFLHPSNGKSITLNISGPIKIDAGAGTTTMDGRSGGPVGTFQGLVLFAGRVTDDGTAHGRLLVDVCAAIA